MIVRTQLHTDKINNKLQKTMKKLVSAIPVGLKCETRNSCFACNSNVCFVGFLYLMGTLGVFLSYCSACHLVCHVCGQAISHVSVTSEGGWWVQISTLKLQHFLAVRVSQKTKQFLNINDDQSHCK